MYTDTENPTPSFSMIHPSTKKNLLPCLKINEKGKKVFTDELTIIYMIW